MNTINTLFRLKGKFSQIKNDAAKNSYRTKSGSLSYSSYSSPAAPARGYLVAENPTQQRGQLGDTGLFPFSFLTLRKAQRSRKPLLYQAK
jgi:hypothetical protein